MTTDINQQIAQAFYFDHLPQPKQQELLAEVSEAVFKGVMVTALEQLSENDQQELSTLFDADAEPETVVQYLQKHVSGFDQIVVDEIKSLKESVDSTIAEATMQAA